MRITPLAVWAAGIRDENIHQQVIEADVSMTHSNKTVKNAIWIYCQAIRLLLNGVTNVNTVYDYTIKLCNDFKLQNCVQDWLETAK